MLVAADPGSTPTRSKERHGNTLPTVLEALAEDPDRLQAAGPTEPLVAEP